MATTATIELLNSGVKFFFRSGKGNRAHASYGCIASRRSIWWGEVQAMTVEETQKDGWTGCGHCCTPADHALLAAASGTPAKPQNCANRGVSKPGRMYSRCIDCGKEGKVNRNTGRLRAHLPADA